MNDSNAERGMRNEKQPTTRPLTTDLIAKSLTVESLKRETELPKLLRRLCRCNVSTLLTL